MLCNSDIFESSLEEEPQKELPPKKCARRGTEAYTPASKLCKAGLTIGKRIPAPSNDWVSMIALSFTGKCPRLCLF